MPAICATPISGMARKFSASPAKVTREKTSAPIGNRSASVAADAANMDNSSHERRRMQRKDPQSSQRPPILKSLPSLRSSASFALIVVIVVVMLGAR